jgi:hypothetical protein
MDPKKLIFLLVRWGWRGPAVLLSCSAALLLKLFNMPTSTYCQYSRGTHRFFKSLSQV